MMKNTLLATLTVTMISLVSISSATAQNAILNQLYGQGVHAYYANQLAEANEYFSMAISNGSTDPRVYYFRGIVAHAQGNTHEAESYWRQGAELEAQGRTNPFVGRALTRFQGTPRLKLEEIRQKARLQAAAMQAARSNQRLGEIQSSPAITAQPPAPPAAPATPGTATPQPPATPESAAPAATPDPFGDEDMAEGEPNVTADDALEGAMEDPFADEAAPADVGGSPPADDANPFGEDAGGGDDIFGGGEDDPFAP